MNLPVLRRAMLWCSRGAALGLLAASVRFGWVATHWAAARYEAAQPAAGEPAERRRRAAPVEQVPSAESESAPTPTAPAQTATSKGAPHEDAAPSSRYEVRTLWVDLGPPRSDVFVSGVRVGQTPYAGTWSCRRGDEVVIHVLPRGAGGVPIESRAACRDSMRAVAGRTLSPEEVAEVLADPTLPGSVKDAFRR